MHGTSLSPAVAATAAPREDRWSRTDAIVLGVLLCLGFALRLHVGLDRPSIVHPDEIYDYLEQGYRLAFGVGEVPWTYEHGLRSYAYPALLAAVMRAGRAFGPDGDLVAVAAFMSALSLSAVVAGYAWGRRAHGVVGGAVTAGLAAVWFELVYFAPHVISECAAGAALTAGMVLADLPRPSGRARLLAAGLCLGLAAAIRIQLAPVALVGVGWIALRRGWRPALLAAGAAALPVVGFGLLDWATYRYPFQSFVLNIWANTAGGVSAHYGVQPWYYYEDLLLFYEGAAAPLLALGALIGARRFPLPFAAAAVLLATHTVLGHKEYRFIVPALPFLVILAGVAASGLVAMAAERLARAAPRRARAAVPTSAAAAIAIMALASYAQGEGAFRREWFRGSGQLAAARAVAARPGVCGIGAYGIRHSALAGAAHYRHDAPVLAFARESDFLAHADGFNVALAYDDDLPATGPFTVVECWNNGFYEASLNSRMPRVCLLVRDGSCTPGHAGDPDPDRPPGW